MVTFPPMVYSLSTARITVVFTDNEAASNAVMRVSLDSTQQLPSPCNFFRISLQTVIYPYNIPSDMYGYLMIQINGCRAGLNQVCFHDPNFATLQTTLKLTQNGRTVFDLDTDSKMLENNRHYQQTTFGDFKNRPDKRMANPTQPGSPLRVFHHAKSMESTTTTTVRIRTPRIMERRILQSKLSWATLKI